VPFEFVRYNRTGGNMRPAKRGFTLTDLSILLAILALLAGSVIPLVFERTSESGGRIRCASNLRQIGQAIQMYAIDNGGSLPRAAYDGSGGAPTEYTNWQAADPFGRGAPGPNDVTAALFLLVRTLPLMPEALVCPTAAGAEPWDFGGQTARQVSNLPGRQFLSYSYHNVYIAPGVPLPAVSTPAADATFALAADMNPGGAAVLSVTPTSGRPEMSRANSPNHNGDGQNVLYADGHVEYQVTVFCGMLRRLGQAATSFRDNIYTFGVTGQPGAGVRGAPVDALDSVLLPTALDGPPPNVRSRIPLWPVVLIPAAVIVVQLFRRRRARRAAHAR
jgi:prepilin-type processing-associated H-X9-DG protein